jgi:hypothetical protein
VTRLRDVIAGWAEALLRNEKATRYQLGEVVGAISKVAEPRFAALVGRMLDRDLEGWRVSRESKIRTRLTPCSIS